MAMTILNEQYPPRKPLLTIEADSLDELPTNDVAEGSTATVGGTEYVYENNRGWIEPDSGGGGGGGGLVGHFTYDQQTNTYTLDKNWQEINAVFSAGGFVVVVGSHEYGTESLSVSQVRYGVAQGEDPAFYMVQASFYQFSSDSPTGTLIASGGE